MKALLATWRGRFIAAFLLVQLLLPLAYYVGRRDPHDERFAWRMFSPMRMAKCTPHFTVGGTPLALPTTFHEAWIEIAERGRFIVLEAMAAKLCHDHPGTPVELTLDCTYLDRDPHTYGGHDMCREPTL
ncbi:MAG: hypothetical protein JO257_16425 [Deltaproteobacteria bacterium]|nr:hypothetical protein [Deltaproteobacteria bacterium]